MARRRVGLLQGDVRIQNKLLFNFETVPCEQRPLSQIGPDRHYDTQNEEAHNVRKGALAS